ncbi:hypothetical protein IGB42_02344 [Andreprevotia sp. IGB-42]|uniref:hypothetical protein n=1 Tax=Andreprevotia sp. IGB-42 TaxID=2497473 RepID=UPI001359A4F1|nr:hypothetical protein [Andreprevotia sp. IGB-42]KAF0812950.1 hypothetical protein IGB42_02344 [Andreprevotia sp. IGB-42]
MQRIVIIGIFLLSIAALAAAWAFRWEVTNTINQSYVRQNRWTGNTELCHPTEPCIDTRVLAAEQAALEAKTQAESKKEEADKAKFQNYLDDSDAQRSAAWGSIREGMSREEIRKLLGKPDRVIGNNRVSSWRYSAEGGVVSFHDEKVSGFAKP